MKAAYVAEGADRDDRLREIFKLAADRSTPMLQVTRNELDRMTDGAVHQGVALQLPEYYYAHPDDLLAAALDADTDAADRRARLDHRPPQPRRGRPLGRRVRRPRRADPRAPLGRHDRGRLEDLGRCRRPAPDRPRDQPQPLAQRVRRRRASPWSAWTARPTPTSRAARGHAGPLVLVIGSEGDGLSRLVRDACDPLASIPITSRSSPSTPASPPASRCTRSRASAGLPAGCSALPEPAVSAAATRPRR